MLESFIPFPYWITQLGHVQSQLDQVMEAKIEHLLQSKTSSFQVSLMNMMYIVANVFGQHFLQADPLSFGPNAKPFLWN